MARPVSGPLDGVWTGDFARADAENGFVVIEANEWDPSIVGYRAVTLYFQPVEARLLAGMLLRIADEAETGRSDGNNPVSLTAPAPEKAKPLTADVTAGEPDETAATNGTKS